MLEVQWAQVQIKVLPHTKYWKLKKDNGVKKLVLEVGHQWRMSL